MVAGDKYFKDEKYIRMAFENISKSKNGKIVKEDLEKVLNTFKDTNHEISDEVDRI